MDREQFEQFVWEGYELLPARIRDKIENVAILVADEPSAQERAQQGLGPDETLLGLYHGIPLAQRGSLYGVGETLPDTITIYQEPITAMCEGDGDCIREQVRDTIWHEVAHHFGMDEPEVRAREAERERGDEVTRERSDEGAR